MLRPSHSPVLHIHTKPRSGDTRCPGLWKVIGQVGKLSLREASTAEEVFLFLTFLAWATLTPLFSLGAGLGAFGPGESTKEGIQGGTGRHLPIPRQQRRKHRRGTEGPAQFFLTSFPASSASSSFLLDSAKKVPMS